MLKLFVLRHGETDFNLRNIVQGGGVDSDLNETGRRQSRAFHEQYRNLYFDGIYCSGLKRTRQTLQGFAETHYPPTVLPEFNEFNWGLIEGKEATDDVVEAFTRMNQRWMAGELEAHIEGGESPAVAWQRLESGLNRIRQAHPEGRVLLCTHGRVLRILLSQLLGYGMADMNRFPHANTALNVLSFRKNGVVTADILNDTSHLNP